MTWEELVDHVRGLGYDSSGLSALHAFHGLLEAGARRLSLTRHTDWDAFAERHVLDSLSLVRALPEDGSALSGGRALRLADLGSGAGIPAIPLAVALPAHDRFAELPAVEVFAIEANGKKATFIREAAEALGLENLQVLSERAETLGRDPGYRDGFDLVVARAVSELRVLVELALPLVRPGGLFIAYKGPKADEEVAAATAALMALGGSIEAVVRASVSGRDLRLVRIRKRGETPGRFPRRPGVAGKRPL